MKEEKRKKRKENGRSPASALVNAPMTSLEIVITEKIGTTEIVIETGTRTGIGKEIVVVVIGIVLVNEDGIVVGTMSMVVIETETVILAMGCRERSRVALNSPGSRAAGIYSA